MRRRQGFALVFTLWILIACAAVAMSVAVTGREEITAIQNRHAEDRAQWMARGCLERARAAIEGALWPDGFTSASVRTVWDELDRRVSMASVDSNCDTELCPAGLALDVNAATPDQLRRLLARFYSNPDSTVDAIVDWRDPDESPRPNGAESGWYASHGMAPPRNGPFVSTEELRLVRGLDNDVLESAVLGVRAERILWRRASPAVLAALPGITDEALSVLASHGLGAITDLSATGSFPEMSVAARDSLARSARDLIPAISSTPEAWTVTATAAFGNPRITSRVTVRFARLDSGLVILERRVLP